MDKLMTVAVDDGFAYTKAARFDTQARRIETWSHPTCICSGVRSITSFSGTSRSVEVYETEGLFFTVGNAMEQEETRFDGYPFSAQNAVMVHHVLLSNPAIASGSAPLHVAASVPMSLFYDETGREAMIERRRKSLMRPVVRQGSDKALRIERVDILPEAASSYIDYVVSDEGKQNFSTLPQVAIIDIGGRTTDVAVMIGGTSIDRSRSGTEEIGVLDLLESIAAAVPAEVARQMGKTVPCTIPARLVEAQLISFQKKGTAEIVLFGRRLDLTGIVERALEAFVRQIHARAQRRIEGISAQMEAILVTGGGAALTQSTLGEMYPHLIVPQDPQYSNVRGMLKYMLYLS